MFRLPFYHYLEKEISLEILLSTFSKAYSTIKSWFSDNKKTKGEYIPSSTNDNSYQKTTTLLSTSVVSAELIKPGHSDCDAGFMSKGFELSVSKAFNKGTHWLGSLFPKKNSSEVKNYIQMEEIPKPEYRG